MLRHRLRRLFALLLLAIAAAPITVAPARATREAAPTIQAEPTPLPALNESEPNNVIAPPPGRANLIDPADPQATKDWSRRVNGAIGSPGDVDYFRFTITRPASVVRISLSNLSDDYDLILGGGSVEEAVSGLDTIADVGSQISSIGSQISSIGSQISSIGSQISSIGSQISSIGSQISSISANPGTATEQIETTLWLPGNYYVAVAAANGDFGSSYTLDVTVLGSELSPAPPAPEVEVRLPPSLPYAQRNAITTLYVINSERMSQVYPADSSQIVSIESYLQELSETPPNPIAGGSSSAGVPEYGYVLDIADLQPISPNSQTVTDAYRLWDDNAGNPFYANFIAGLIDNTIDALVADETPGRSGENPQFRLGSENAPLASFPNLKYVVLVGNDLVLPFFRLPDLTTIANEADYLEYTNAVEEGGLIDPALPLGAALKARTILSDNPYGAVRPYRFPGSPLYVPHLAVGRLVETPEDIVRYLNFYHNYFFDNSPPNFNHNAFTIDPVAGEAEAFVSGYDFLKDQADEVTKSLGLGGYFTPSVCGVGVCSPGHTTALVDDTWTRDDLEREWFNGELSTVFSDTVLNSPFARHVTNLNSLNAHFDHWQILPAQGSAGNFEARRILAPDYDYFACGSSSCYPGYFARTLSYSVGCHSGYNVMPKAMTELFRQLNPVPAQQALIERYSSDFAQATIRHAGNWIGNTGYGYGTLDGVDYSERLSVLISEELFTEVTDPLSPTLYIGQSIGEALRNAKLRYLRNASSLGVYDAKAVQVMTLYGLPYIRFFGFDGFLLPPPSEEGRPNDPPPAEHRTPVPTQAPSGLLERTITFDINIGPDDFRTIQRTGSRLLELDPSDFTVTDSFVSAGFPAQPVRVFENNQAGLPSLPRFAYDISALNNAGSERLVVRDVQFVEGSYGEQANFNPQVTQIVTETDTPLTETSTEPNLAAGAGVWYPDKFFGFSSVGEGDELRDQLVAAAAQFQSDPDGVKGILRPYTRMVFRVIYIDPAASSAPNTLADTDPPTIQAVRLEQVSTAGLLKQGPQARVVVLLDEGGSDVKVEANFVQGAGWQKLAFSRPNPTQAPNRYVAPLPQLVGDVRVIVRATDAAGNSSYFTAKGSFAPPPGPRLFLPELRR